jgi:DNA invertase Pin-like site-specific DNA recombinase
VETLHERSLKLSSQQTNTKFVAYYRVSTARQGRSGLGLDAQRSQVEAHIRSIGGHLVAEFIEIESGKLADRAELRKALTACRLRRATLIIAKLDRLARNVAFVSALMDAGTEFVAVDNPHANKFTVHVLSALAEHERELISSRTRAALTAAKARGVVLGRPQNLSNRRLGARRSADARAARAKAAASEIRPVIDDIRRNGAASLRAIAAALNEFGYRTSCGSEWTHIQVRSVLDRTN